MRYSSRKDITINLRKQCLVSLLVFTFGAALVGCRSYVQSTPARYWEEDNPGNYKRVFHEDVPADVSIGNSVVVTYTPRPGVVTSGDFEFEVVVPSEWIEKAAKRFYLWEGDSDFIQREV